MVHREAAHHPATAAHSAASRARAAAHSHWMQSATSSPVSAPAAAALGRFAPAASLVKPRNRSPAVVLGVEVPRPRFRSSSFFFFCQFAAAAAVHSHVAAVVPTAAATAAGRAAG